MDRGSSFPLYKKIFGGFYMEEGKHNFRGNQKQYNAFLDDLYKQSITDLKKCKWEKGMFCAFLRKRVVTSRAIKHMGDIVLFFCPLMRGAQSSPWFVKQPWGIFQIVLTY